MGYKTIDVIKHKRTLKSGKTIDVSKHKRQIPYDDSLDVLSDKWVEEWHKKRMEITNPDHKEIARITFEMPNKLWLEHPDKYDVLGLDTIKVPEYKKIPTKPGLPGQIIKVKGKFYKCDKFGRFRRTFPREEPANPDLSKEFLIGGYADNMPKSKYNPDQLAMGINVEMEHTDNPKVAEEIAKDHLEEIPDYYTYLEKMEKEAGVKHNPHNPYDIKPKKDYGVYAAPRYSKYSEIVTYESPEKAKVAVKKLEKEFNSAKTNAKRRRVAKVVQLAETRAKVSIRQKNFKPETKKRYKEVSEIYSSLAEELWDKYAKIND